MRTADYNAEKFRELLIYIAEQTADDPTFGDTKLNKALYFCDFFGYSHLGHAITGARYQKLPYGPAAVPLKPVRRELEAEGAVGIEERAIGTRVARITVAKRPARRDLFDAEELALIDDVVRQIRTHTAASVSNMSHRQSAGWNLVELNEDIPYSTALISTEPPSDRTIANARDVARARLGW
ncbi:MAG: hypothetical protein JWQ18_1560 [Conexibacter sp.]|nr:hypothetical protein [Conexibacter sp.]